MGIFTPPKQQLIRNPLFQTCFKKHCVYHRQTTDINYGTAGPTGRFTVPTRREDQRGGRNVQRDSRTGQESATSELTKGITKRYLSNAHVPPAFKVERVKMIL